MAVSAKTMKAILRRHGAAVSAVTAGAVALAIAVQRLLTTLITFVVALPQFQQGALYDIQPVFTMTLGALLLPGLPFAVGFFLSLWLVAPIAAELRLPHVMTRAILATGIGATVLFIVLAVVGLVMAFAPGAGSFAGNSFPFPEFSSDRAVFALSSALRDALTGLVTLLPLGVLAGILLWHWRKDHPPKQPLEGFIDV